jgi:excisionase family DNA binding protein
MADLLTVTVQAIHLWHEKGKLRVVRVGNQYRIPFSEVKRLLIERGEDPFARLMERRHGKSNLAEPEPKGYKTLRK